MSPKQSLPTTPCWWRPHPSPPPTPASCLPGQALDHSFSCGSSGLLPPAAQQLARARQSPRKPSPPGPLTVPPRLSISMPRWLPHFCHCPGTSREKGEMSQAKKNKNKQTNSPFLAGRVWVVGCTGEGRAGRGQAKGSGEK